MDNNATYTAKQSMIHDWENDSLKTGRTNKCEKKIKTDNFLGYTSGKELSMES